MVLILRYAGHSPVFCPSATRHEYISNFRTRAWTQRQRWEQGHIDLDFNLSSIADLCGHQIRDWKLLVLLLDLIVPPISLLVTLLTTMLLATVAAFILGMTSQALLIVAICLTIFVAATLGLAWFNYARDILPCSSFILIGTYFARKLGLYGALLAGQKPPDGSGPIAIHQDFNFSLDFQTLYI